MNIFYISLKFQKLTYDWVCAPKVSRSKKQSFSTRSRCLELYIYVLFLECKDQERKIKHFSPLADSRSVRVGGCCYVHRHYWQWGQALRASNFHSVGQFEIIAQHWYMHQPEPPIRNVRNVKSIHCVNVILSGEGGTHRPPQPSPQHSTSDPVARPLSAPSPHPSAVPLTPSWGLVASRRTWEQLRCKER